ncbi:hypothetical protein EH240_33800 [Mesorhizobium tamadayense]|uniref:DUF3606 domain-containing protein n=1 Tax=Mesorhizobium tamadayense TaxID=425306 RepID=A0A3P3ET16_9HYPH|nr:hypothetical protein [Mesorhizobium tamadayense]RRH89559.1 hypothetical protein EH240_33800 [Mesorhizobium tamadayense]
MDIGGRETAQRSRLFKASASAFPVFESERQRAERVKAEKGFRVRHLMRETGITEAQALDLIDLIGNDTNSLLREARLLNK